MPPYFDKAARPQPALLVFEVIADKAFDRVCGLRRTHRLLGCRIAPVLHRSMMLFGDLAGRLGLHRGFATKHHPSKNVTYLVLEDPGSRPGAPQSQTETGYAIVKVDRIALANRQLEARDRRLG